jgi:cobalt/nickel transport system ATP-binding protein
MNHDRLIQLENIDFGYSSRAPILRSLDFTLQRGDRIGLVAPNGSGKTTLFHIIMGLLTPLDGTISLFGKPMRREKDFARMRSRIGLLFQDPDDQLFNPTVLEDVAFGPLNMGKSKKDAIAISEKTLAYLGLEGFEDRVTIKLSGGEKRLVALATILAMEPEILLLDEPTSGLDDATKQRLKQVLGGLNLSFILISHEYDFLTAVVDRIHTLEDGTIRADRKLHIHLHEHAHVHGKQPHKHI